MKKTLFLALAALIIAPAAVADEGMWIPMLLNRNEAAMQKAGMHISASDIYDVNQASLKDAVVLFGSGCSGEFVSPEGLLLTNHHCGYSYIVSHSTVEHDYLTHGFWAMDRSQELPCPGLTATRLVRMEEVTAEVLDGVEPSMSESDRQTVVDNNIKAVSERLTQGTHYRCVIKPFYYGNQYFAYINEVFTDVRLVGTPPSNIGKFGGDTDNWMWPRHTGDFSVFRVYAGKDNKPAEYSKDNQPYHPLRHLEISLKGVDEGDFTFVFGYPGTTRRYVTHDAVNLAANVENPIRIAMRDIRLRNYKAAQELSPALRLRYATPVANIANGWKKWQGETLGINRLHGVEQKRSQEAAFRRWAAGKPEYRNVLGQLESLYKRLRPVAERRVWFSEAILASDLMQRAQLLHNLYMAGNDTDRLLKAGGAIDRSNARLFDEDSIWQAHLKVDRAIFVETFIAAWRAGQAPYMDKKHKSEADVRKTLNRVFDRSILNNPDRFAAFMDQYDGENKADRKTISKDPAFELLSVARSYALGRYNGAEDQNALYNRMTDSINLLMRTYVKGMMEMYPDSNFFPDANLTLRVAYGHVEGFRPRDAVRYTHYSTLDGIIEKENPDIYDYVVEPRLKELWRSRDYGPFANELGEMPVAFIATNHTTGGNSGSPVLDADGRLIGINFDRCWEGTMSDLLFDPAYCRNISLDVRYCLFIIDRFAGASHLINEMTLVR
ncbi:MAG: S46 family peptidase [Bacteroidales bacterium]|nr:S46 family peptidase [Bacteroidales bacterium]